MLLFPSKEWLTVCFFSVQLNFLKIDLFLILLSKFLVFVFLFCFYCCGLLVCLVVVVVCFGGRLGIFVFGCFFPQLGQIGT